MSWGRKIPVCCDWYLNDRLRLCKRGRGWGKEQESLHGCNIELIGPKQNGLKHLELILAYADKFTSVSVANETVGSSSIPANHVTRG